MNAVWFLWINSFKNGIRRALTSPKRLITLIFFSLYLIFAIIRPFFYAASQGRAANIESKIHITSSEIEAVVFGFYLIIGTISLMLIGSYNRTLKSADIEMLFPTPVPVKVVMTARVIRDFVATFTFQIFFAFVFLVVSASMPHQSVLVRVGARLIVGWILVNLTFTSWGYVYNLTVLRDAPKSIHWEKVADYTRISYVILIVAVIALKIFSDSSLQGFVDLGHDPWLELMMFPAYFSYLFVASPVLGYAFGIIGLVAVIGLIAAGFFVAYQNSGWLYDIASSRGSKQLKRQTSLRSGDYSGLIRDRIIQKNIKYKSNKRLMSWRVQGIGSLIWRELVLAPRQMRAAKFLVLLVAVGYGIFPVLIFGNHDQYVSTEVLGAFLLFTQGIGVFMSVAVQQISLSIFLKQTDLLKPLPFSSSMLVLAELLSRSWIPSIASPISSIIIMIMRPTLAPIVIGFIFYMPSLAVLLLSALMIAVLIFPDVGDATQRAFRGYTWMLGTALVSLPGAGLMVLIYLAVHMALLGGIVGAIVNSGISALLIVYAGKLFQAASPSD